MPHVLGYRSPSGYGYPGLGSVLDITAPGTQGLIGHWIPIQAARPGAGSSEIAGRSTVSRNDIVVPTGYLSTPSNRFGYVWSFNSSQKITFYDTGTDAPVVLRPSANPSKAFSAAIWAKTTATGGAFEMNIMGMGPNNVASRVWSMEQAVTSQVAVFRVNGSSLFAATGTKVLNDGVWHHLVGTWDNQEIRLYVDGNLEAITAFAGGVGGNFQGLLLGDLGAAANRYNGQLTHFMYWQRALKESEVKMLHQDPFIMYLARGIIPEAIPVPTAITSTHWSQFGNITRLAP